MTRSEAREHVFRILFEQEFHPEQDVEMLINDYMFCFPEGEPDDKALDFIKKEVKGTLSHLCDIDPKISSELRGWSLERISRVDRAILRMALYEIDYTSEKEIPASVSINEAIEIAKKYSEGTSGSFINGVLANFAKREGK